MLSWRCGIIFLKIRVCHAFLSESGIIPSHLTVYSLLPKNCFRGSKPLQEDMDLEKVRKDAL